MLKILIPIAIFTLVGCKEDQASAVSECPKLTAFEVVKKQVVERLVSPGSAVFPADPGGPLYSNSEVIIAKMGDCAFGISSHVDSQNGMGALLRTNFSADVKFESSKSRWTVTSLLLAPR